MSFLAKARVCIFFQTREVGPTSRKLKSVFYFWIFRLLTLFLGERVASMTMASMTVLFVSFGSPGVQCALHGRWGQHCVDQSGCQASSCPSRSSLDLEFLFVCLLPCSKTRSPLCSPGWPRQDMFASAS